MADYKTLKVTYAYNRVEYNELTLRYSYLPVPVQTNELDLTYSFDASTGNSFNKLAGHWSDHTQMICNDLPFWHAGRFNDTSNYQQLINGFAMSAEYLSEQHFAGKKNKYLDTVESDLAYSGFIQDYPKVGQDLAEQVSPNVIYNSDLSIPGRAIPDTPCRWAIDKSTGAIVKADSEYSLSAGNALAISVESGEYASAYQSYAIRMPEGQDLVLSAMVMVPNHSGRIDTNIIDSNQLQLDVLYVDGSVGQSYVDIPTSTTEEGILSDNSTGQIAYWEKVHTTISLAKPSAYIKCNIKSDYRYNTSDYSFYIDCFQLEIGKIPTRWTRRDGETVPWAKLSMVYSDETYNIYSNNTSDYTQTSVVLNSNTSYYNIRPKTRIFKVTDENTFYNDAIPTRLRSVAPSTESAISVNTMGLATNQYERASSTMKWSIDPHDSSKIKKSSLQFNDDYGSFAIAERDYFGDNTNKYTVIKDHMNSGSETYTLAIRALTIDHDYLVAFCRESLGARVYYTFKFISSKRGFQGTYLECIQDFKVPDATASLFNTGVETGSVLFSQMGKVDGSRSKFVVETNDGVIKYETDFAYDYYIDADDGQFFTREKYDQICVT
jgi:hypothetical protein